MKKTLNINLAGYPFTIDEDAYKLLEDYLDTIRFAFDTKEDTGELAADIEARIAELLMENEGGRIRIVSREEVSKVIERIGKPSEFIEIEEEVKTQEKESSEEVDTPNSESLHSEEEIQIEEEKITPPPYESKKLFGTTWRKKLFRDPQNSMLGGVCAGLAVYLNIDVTIVRLLTVLLFFLSATTVAIAYIILWIVVPEAVTPLQRMQMMGQDPTMENIGKTVTENHLSEENKTSEENTKTGFQKFLSSALSIFVKCLIILGLLIGLPLLIAIGAAILGCVIAIFVISIGIVGGGMFDTINEGLMVLFILLAVIGGAITIGIPLWLLIRMAFKKNDSNMTPNNRRSLLIIWLIGIALTAVFTVKAIKKGRYIDHDSIRENIENLQFLNDLDMEDIEDIKINNGKVTVTTKEGIKYKINKGAVTIESATSEEPEPSDAMEEASGTEVYTDSMSIITQISETVRDSIN